MTCLECVEFLQTSPARYLCHSQQRASSDDVLGKANMMKPSPATGPKPRAAEMIRFEVHPDRDSANPLFPQPFEIFQSPERVFMFFERDHAWRQIWTDGRSHPKDLEPTWMGDRSANGEGDTFVVTRSGSMTRAGWIFTAIRTVHAPDRALQARGSQHHVVLQLSIAEDPKATRPSLGHRQDKQAADRKESIHGRTLRIPEEEDATNRIRMPAAESQVAHALESVWQLQNLFAGHGSAVP